MYCDARCQSMNASTHLRFCEKLDFPVQSIHSINGKVGLKNIGNTCYMNSGLQCLSNTEELSQYILKKEYEADKNTDNALGSGCRLLTAYANLIFQMWNGENNVVAPDKFKYELSKMYNMFDGYAQHDSQEFLSHLLDGLHEDVNLIKKKPYTECIEAKPGQSDYEVARESWKTFLKRNYSQIIKLFYGQFRSQIKCPKCQNQSVTFDAYQIVSLPIPNSSTSELASTDFTFFEIEVNQYKSAIKKKVRIKMKIDESVTVGTFKKLYAKEIGRKPEEFIITKAAFEEYGEIISDKTHFSQYLEVKPSKSFNPFVFFLDEEEQQLIAEPDTINIICKVGEGEGFNKFIFAKESTTVEQIYYKVFKKFAHFHDYDEEGLSSTIYMKTSDPIPEVDYQDLYRKYFRRGGDKMFFSISMGEDESTKIEINSPLKLSDLMATYQGIYSQETRTLNVRLLLKPEASKMIRIELMKKCSEARSPIIIEEANTDETPNLTSLIELFSNPETLDNDNQWYCKDCKEHMNAIKTIQIYKAPKILIIQMKKLKTQSMRGRYYGSDNNHLLVEFPLEGLDLTDYVLNKNPMEEYNIDVMEFLDENNNLKALIEEKEKKFTSTISNDRLIYDCFGVVNHFGSNFSGHYTAFVKKENEWCEADDSRFTRAPDGAVVSKAAYVLFYRRRD